MASSNKVQQLLKLKERGDITLSQFLSLSGQIPDDDAVSDDGAAEDENRDHQMQDGDAAAAAAGDDMDVEEALDVDGHAVDEVQDDGCSDSDADDAPSANGEAAAPPEAAQALPNTILNFIAKNCPAQAAIAATRKPNLSTHKKKESVVAKKKRQALAAVRNADGRGTSTKKQGARLNDVKPETMKRRLEDFPDETLIISGGQIWCKACKCNVASGKQPLADHCKRPKHEANVKKIDAADTNRAAVQEALHNYKSMVTSEHGDDAQIVGMTQVPQNVQVLRAEALEEFLKAGVEVLKLNELRPYLERISGISLTGRQHMVSTFLPPLKVKEETTLRAEYKNEFVGVYHDGTTHNGESFAVVYRACKPGFVFRICCVRLHFLRGSMTADQISTTLLQTCAVHMQVRTSRCRHCSAPPSVLLC